MIRSLQDKDKELNAEVEELRGHQTQMEKQVNEFSASLAKELSDKVKTRCLVVQS